MKNIIEIDLDISKYILNVSTDEQLNKKLNEARKLLFGSIDEYYNYCNNGILKIDRDIFLVAVTEIYFGSIYWLEGEVVLSKNFNNSYAFNLNEFIIKVISDARDKLYRKRL